MVVLLCIFNIGLLTYNIFTLRDELVDHPVVTHDNVLFGAFCLLVVYTLRLLYTFTVRSDDQYHGAIEEHYTAGEFSDTESERLQEQVVNAERKHRFEKTVMGYRQQNDLTTVRESCDGENNTHVYADSLNPAALDGKKSAYTPQSYFSRNRDEQQTKHNHSAEYHSFNFR